MPQFVVTQPPTDEIKVTTFICLIVKTVNPRKKVGVVFKSETLVGLNFILKGLQSASVAFDNW